jgi:hypothetical protein
MTFVSSIVMEDKMEIRIHGLTKLNAKQQFKIRSALDKGVPVIMSDIWADKVRKMKITNNVAYGKTYSNEEIITMFRTGVDDPRKPGDGFWDIQIEGYFTLRGVVGFTYLNSLKQFINRRLLDKYTEASVFSHIVHETVHGKLHFGHRGSKKFDVSYQMGRVSYTSFEEYYSKPREHIESLTSGFKITIVD